MVEELRDEIGAGYNEVDYESGAHMPGKPHI